MPRNRKQPDALAPGTGAMETAAAGQEVSMPSPEAAALARHERTPATLRAYGAALARLDEWLAGAPLTDRSLADYLAARHADGLAPASLTVTVAAVAFTASRSGRPNPAGPETARVMDGARRQGRARGRGQVSGVQWEQADAAAALAARDGSPSGLRDAALIAVASDAMLRVGEIAALAVRDLGAEANGSGRLTLHHSKTDQEGEGAVLYLGPSTMQRVRAWREAADIEDGPLFRRIRRGGAVQAAGLSSRAVRSIIAARCDAAGIEGRVSGHSLRVGAAQSLAAAGAGLVEMQTAGRWDAPAMPARYARGELAGRNAVARLRHKT